MVIIIIIIIINQKAFDSVPHSWMEKSIALVGVNSKIARFCKLSMEKWNTRLHSFIQIGRGIFKGDSLSPLIFA